MKLNALLFKSKKLLNSSLSKEDLDVELRNLRNILENMDESYSEYYGALSEDTLDLELYYLKFNFLD